jgi:hypothetical protein
MRIAGPQMRIAGPQVRIAGPQTRIAGPQTRIYGTNADLVIRAGYIATATSESTCDRQPATSSRQSTGATA